MLRAKNVDITGGPILKSIVIYAIPIIIGTLVQQLFNAADLMVLSNMANEAEKDIVVASVGATSHIVNLLVNSFVGLGAGVSVLVARMLGQGDEKRAKRVANTAIITALVIGALMAVVCILSADAFLTVTNCPENCISGATLYLDIYAIGIPFILFYNFGAAIIRTTGDTQRPLYYLIVSGLLNVILNVVFCLILEQKVAAVAIATTASQILSAICVCVHLFKLAGPCKLEIKKLTFSFGELGNIVKLGFPAAVNSALFSLSNLQIVSEVNLYGEALMAGSAAAQSLEHITVAVSGGFNAATLPFVGQNVGAGKPERVKRSILCCIMLAGASNFLIASTIYIFRDIFLLPFLPQGGLAAEYASVKLLWVLMPYCIASMFSTFTSSMQAFGYSFVPMIDSLVCVLGIRFIWMMFVYPVMIEGMERSLETAAMLYMCYPISWFVCLIAHSIAFSIIYSRYKKGKIKKV